MAYDYFYNQQIEQYIHFQMPMALFDDDKLNKLSINAKLLYCLLFERAKLSFKNGRIDENGRVYIHFTQSELKDLLNCGKTKIIEYFKELDGANGGVGLIERKQKNGFGKSDVIYVKNFASGNAFEATEDRPENSPFAYFHDMGSLRFRHLCVPKVLFTDEHIKGISNAAKIAYVLMLNRTQLSKSKGWQDEQGRIYIVYPQNELQERLGVSLRTVKTVMSELENNAHLIIRKKQRMNKPDIIYVLDYGTALKYETNKKMSIFGLDTNEDDNVNLGGAKCEPLEVQNLNLGGAKYEPLEVQNMNLGSAKSEPVYINNTKYNNTDFSHSQSVSHNESDRRTDRPVPTDFSHVLKEIGFDTSQIFFEPKSEQDFEDYDEESRQTQNCSIPYQLRENKNNVQNALKFLFAYSYYEKMNEHNKYMVFLNSTISALSEMIMIEKATYNKTEVRSCDIIDELNKIIKKDYLIEWFNDFEQDWQKILVEQKPKTRKYLYACIWEKLHLYEYNKACIEMAAEALCSQNMYQDNKTEDYNIAFNNLNDTNTPTYEPEPISTEAAKKDIRDFNTILHKMGISESFSTEEEFYKKHQSPNSRDNFCLCTIPHEFSESEINQAIHLLATHGNNENSGIISLLSDIAKNGIGQYSGHEILDILNDINHNDKLWRVVHNISDKAKDSQTEPNKELVLDYILHYEEYIKADEEKSKQHFEEFMKRFKVMGVSE